MPSILLPLVDTIPLALQALPQWVLWQGTLTHDRHGHAKIKKVPYTIRYRKASSIDPQTWTTYDRVIRALPLALEEWGNVPESLGGGIGFVFTAADPYVGIDLDHARDPATGDIAGWAHALLASLDTYTEVSISGTGAHAICTGQWPAGRNRKGDVEIYQTARFFTISGVHLPPYPFEIRERGPALQILHAQLFPPAMLYSPSRPHTGRPAALTDDEIILKATKAKNGGKFRTLWAGDYGEYASASEADLALCSLLAFWTQDSVQLDSLFRQSGLYRDKWNTRRGSEQTYGDRTIAYALEHLGERYDPSRVRPKETAQPPHFPPQFFARNGSDAGEPPTENTDAHTAQSTPLVWSLDSSPRQAIALRCDKQDHPYPDAGNFHTIFTYYPPWKGRLWWDSFGQLPMHDDRILDDAALTTIAAWCGHELQMSVRSEDQLRRSLFAVAKSTPRDPLQEFVETLTWDGQPRVARWLHTYCGAEDTKAHAWIGTALCCALVARALMPGCMQRCFVILEGAENLGKSAVCQLLGHPWARTLSRDIDTKDAQMLLRGCWVMEVPELDSFRKAEESRIKSFLTERKDSIILKYENSPTTYLRRTVLIGTVNPDGNGYLKGQTGNTRYLPVLCTAINLAALETDRCQLFAEAKHLLAQQYHWWEEPGDIGLGDVREERRDTDVFETTIATWLEERLLHDASEAVTLEEVLQKALRITEPERWKDRALQTRVGVIIKQCGWRRYRKQDGDIRRYLYTKTETKKKS